MTEQEEPEYLAAQKRLRKWRKSELERKLAEIPAPVHRPNVRPDPLNTTDPLGIGSAGTKKKVQR